MEENRLSEADGDFCQFTCGEIHIVELVVSEAALEDRGDSFVDCANYSSLVLLRQSIFKEFSAFGGGILAGGLSGFHEFLCQLVQIGLLGKQSADGGLAAVCQTENCDLSGGCRCVWISEFAFGRWWKLFCGGLIASLLVEERQESISVVLENSGRDKI